MMTTVHLLQDINSTLNILQKLKEQITASTNEVILQELKEHIVNNHQSMLRDTDYTLTIPQEFTGQVMDPSTKCWVTCPLLYHISSNFVDNINVLRAAQDRPLITVQRQDTGNTSI